MEEFLELIEHNLRNGTAQQKAIAIELLLRLLERGTINAPGQGAG